MRQQSGRRERPDGFLEEQSDEDAQDVRLDMLDGISDGG